MKRIVILLCTLSALSAMGQGNVKLNTRTDTLSWVLGESYAKAYLNTGLSLDKDIIISAFSQTLNNQGQPIDDDTYKAVFDYLSFNIVKLQKQKQQLLVEKTQKAEEAYFQKLLADHPDIKQAPEGFYYEVIRAGFGPKAPRDKRISFDYRGFNMLTGEPIDQTYGKRDPIVTVLNEHIFPGLLYGLQLMEAGSIYRFYFPNALAFGPSGSQNIPPYTSLIYEVELHTIFND